MSTESNNSSFSFKRLPWLWIALCVISAVVGFVLVHQYGREMTPSTLILDKTEREVKLYFVSKDGKLLAEERAAIKKGTLESEIRGLMEGLIRGSNGSLERTIPVGARIMGVKVEGNLALVDFSGHIKTKHWGGSTAELLTVYSIVNAVTANFKKIEKVQILIEGERFATLAGHVKIDRPITPDLKMIEG